MAILRRCRGSCSNPRRCLDHLWFDVMYGGARYRVAANDFAVPRMEPDKQRPIESMEEARQWERLFIGEIQAGRDPRRPRKRRAATDTTPKTVAPLMGEHNREIAAKLGFSAAEIDAMVADGVLYAEAAVARCADAPTH